MGKTPEKIFEVLNRHYTVSSEKGRSMLLNAFVKLTAKYPELADQTQIIFSVASEHADPDL